MALINCNFFSEVLGMSMSMNVILPQETIGQVGVSNKTNEGPFRCLYLLHGLSDNHSIWQRHTSIERYVASLGIAVVMPNVHRSFYTDMRHGYKYWTYISEEIPRLARSFFPLSDKREDNFVAGLSMGGYGAFKLALTCPDRFCAAASLSGALNMADRLDEIDEEDRSLIYGHEAEVRGSENDLLALAERAVHGRAQVPRLYQCCGTEDFLYDHNICFRDHALSLGLDLTYEESPGEHEWGYWDKQIQRVLEWMFQ